MPYGMPSTDFLKRLGGPLNSTEDAVAMSDKFGIPLNELLARIQIPRFINVQYRFSSIADILEMEFTKMLEQNIHFRKCKRCGKYFIMKGNYDTNYCSRIPNGWRTPSLTENRRLKKSLPSEHKRSFRRDSL